MKNCRGAAAQILNRVIQKKQSLTPLLIQFEANVADNEKALLQAMCYGTCRHFYSLNAYTKIMLEKPLPEEANEITALIWIGLYQLDYMSIAEHAVINETVNAVESLGFSKYKPLVNALLRRFQRERKQLKEGLQSSDVPKYEHPKWLLKQIKKDWPDHWQQICTAANQHPPMMIRINTHKISVDNYKLLLDENTISSTQTSASDFGLVLTSPKPVSDLPQFFDGYASVQDEAAQLAAQILKPKINDHILDACAAPGGKTCHLLEYCEGNASVVALDSDPKRLERVNENLARLGYQATTLTGEAQNPDTWWDGKLFDRILLDVPCSATGVIRRHPDIKLLREKADIANLANLQGEILKKAWTLLKPGGQLLYATCSILPIENTLNVKTFISQEPTASIAPMSLPSNVGIDTGFGRQLFPQPDGHDGFFYALIEKAE